MPPLLESVTPSNTLAGETNSNRQFLPGVVRRAVKCDHCQQEHFEMARKIEKSVLQWCEVGQALKPLFAAIRSQFATSDHINVVLASCDVHKDSMSAFLTSLGIEEDLFGFAIACNRPVQLDLWTNWLTTGLITYCNAALDQQFDLESELKSKPTFKTDRPLLRHSLELALSQPIANILQPCVYMNPEYHKPMSKTTHIPKNIKYFWENLRPINKKQFETYLKQQSPVEQMTQTTQSISNTSFEMGQPILSASLPPANSSSIHSLSYTSTHSNAPLQPASSLSISNSSPVEPKSTDEIGSFLAILSRMRSCNVSLQVDDWKNEYIQRRQQGKPGGEGFPFIANEHAKRAEQDSTLKPIAHVIREIASEAWAKELKARQEKREEKEKKKQKQKNNEEKKQEESHKRLASSLTSTYPISSQQTAKKQKVSTDI